MRSPDGPLEGLSMVALLGQAAALEPGRADTPRAACMLAPRRPAGRYRHLDVGRAALPQRS
jgi:hypothetical protein